MGTVYEVNASSDLTCGDLIWDNTNRLLSVMDAGGTSALHGIRFGSTPSSGTNIFSVYEKDTQTFTWTGPFGTNPTSNVTYEIEGDSIIISIGIFSAAAGGSASTIISSAPLPSHFIPPIDRFNRCFVQTGGAMQFGTISVRANGYIEFGVNIPNTTGVLTAFPNAGGNNGAVLGAQICYSLANV